MQFRQILIPARGRNTYTGYTFNQGDATVINNGGGGGVGTNYWTLENNSMISTPYNVVGYEDVSAYGNGSFSGFSLSVIDNLNSTSTTDALSANQGRVLKEMIENISGGTASSVAWSNITGKPTTIAGYGITDTYTKSQVDTALAGKSDTGHTHTFSSITSKPTTIAGYGITDTYTKTEVDTALAGKSDTGHTHTFASITNKPTTLTGYGITDTFLPLSGGTLTGTSADLLVINRSSTSNVTPWTTYKSNGTLVGRLGVSASKVPQFNNGSSTYTIYHSGNANSTSVAWSASTLLSAGDVSAYGGASSPSWSLSVIDNLTSNSTTDALSANQGRILKGLIDNFSGGTASSVAWSNITGKPTTIAGYGITDAYTKTEVDTALAGKSDTGHTHTFSSLTSKPTTIAGYGITNAYTKTQVDNLLAGKSDTGHTHTFASITDKPTTLSGYGITDAYTKSQVDTALAGKSDTSHTHTFASLTSKPTTVAGYGITDAVTTAGTQSITGAKTFTQQLKVENANGSNSFIRNYTYTGTSNASPIFIKGQISGTDAAIFGGYKPAANPSGITYATIGMNSVTSVNMLRLYPTYAAWGENVIYHAGNSNNTSTPWSASTLLSAGDVSAYGGASSPSWSLSVIDNLNSTSTTDALSAKQGKVLKEMIENISGGTASSIAWTNITNKPTTIAGYGITDAYTKTEVDTALAGKSDTGHTHTFSSLTSKPTTVGGYGIGNAVTTNTAQNISGGKNFTSAVTVTSNLVAQCFVRNFNYTGDSGRAPIFFKGQINGTDSFIISGIKQVTNPSGMTYVSIGMGNTLGAPVGNDTNMLRIYPTYVAWGANTIYHAGNANNSGTTWKCSTLSATTINVTGDFVAGGDVFAFSDARLKSDIKDLDNRGKLKPKTYIKDGKQSIGFIAQDVQELYPELVSPDENGMLRLNYQQVTAVLAAQINEQEEIIKKQETELANLKNEVNELKKIIEEKLK